MLIKSKTTLCFKDTVDKHSRRKRETFTHLFLFFLNVLLILYLSS